MATRKKTAKKTTRRRAAAPEFRARVRMYRIGLGDCFLLTFAVDGGERHILIDCGSIGEQTTGVTLEDAVEDIIETTGGVLDVLVATHEHQDHVIGFLRQKELFDQLEVKRVWLAWTENPRDELAQEVAKKRGDLVAALGLALRALDERGGRRLDSLRHGIRGILGFVGDVPDAGSPFAAKELSKTVHEAMAYVTWRGDARDGDRFLSPGRVLEPDWLPGWRVYVLGPPRDKSRLNSLGEHGDEDLYGLGADAGTDFLAGAELRASGLGFGEFRGKLEGDERAEFERRLPFDPRYRVEPDDLERLGGPGQCYADEQASWRRIDDEWLRVGGQLALQLDNATNNTSLVLAFELIEDGRVMLFPGDAQLGSWLSWHDLSFTVSDSRGRSRSVTAADLLARTVFYKVGHHASHNATASRFGLELMRRDDLVCFIPLDAVSARNKWPTATWPNEHVYAALMERAEGRVVRSDGGGPVGSAGGLVDPNSRDTLADRDAKTRLVSSVQVHGLRIQWIMT